LLFTQAGFRIPEIGLGRPGTVEIVRLRAELVPQALTLLTEIDPLVMLDDQLTVTSVPVVLPTMTPPLTDQLYEVAPVTGAML
jgi:hypothetical protein